MRSLQDEIRQVQRELSCPVCGRTFALRDIRLKADLETGKAELSVVCGRGHFPVILLIPVDLAEAVEAGPISRREVKQASQRIDNIKKISEIIK